MSKKDKLIKKLKSKPKDFTYKELRTLLGLLGYTEDTKGKTSGSRMRFISELGSILIHKPHGRNYLLEYQVKEILENLSDGGLV